MPGQWHIHDAGLIQLELPPDWVARQPSPGTLLLEDPDAGLGVAIIAVSRSEKGAAPPATLDAQHELQKWIDRQKHVQIQRPPALLPRTLHATAAAEGIQHPRAGGKWYKRLFRRKETLLWRFWAMVNPHLLVLASSHGKPAALDAQRPLLDRLIASMHLPGEDILTGRRFTEMVVSLAKTWFPETSVVVIDDAHLQFGATHISLDRLHRRYLASPQQLPAQVRTLLAQAHQNLPASAALDGWADVKAHVMPVFLRRETLINQKGRVLHEEWINSLYIAYAVHKPDAGASQPDRLITRDDLRHWSVEQEELQSQAQQNLVAQSHDQVMEGRREEGCTLLTLSHPDRHNAVRVLLPELHHKLREHLGQTFYAAIPTRHTLRAFNTRDPQILRRIRTEIARDYAAAVEPLSNKLFLVTPDGIAGDPADGIV